MSLRISTRGLRRRKLRNGLTILAVVFAVSILVGVNVAGDSLMVQVTNTVMSSQGDIDISVRYATGEAFGIGNSSTVSSQPGIRAVSPLLGGSIYYLNQSLILPFTLVGIVPALDNDFGVSNISLNLLSQTNSCIVTEQVAREYNVTSGSTVTVSQVRISPPSDTLWTLRVIGVAHIEGKGYSAVMITNLSLAQGIFDSGGKVNSIVASVVNIDDTMAILRALQARLGSNFQVLAPKESTLSQVQGINNGFRIAMNMAATISLAVACILIMNSLLMAVNERKYETGVLRSIGSSRGTVFRIFLLEGLFFGAIGSVFGVVTGIYLSQFLASYMASVLNVAVPPLIVNSYVPLFGAVSGLAVAGVGSVYPALSASKTNVVQAIRPQMRGGGGGRLGTGIMASLGGVFLLVSYYVNAHYAESTNFAAADVQQLSLNLTGIYIMMILIPAGILLLSTAAMKGISAVLSYLFYPVFRSRRTIATRNIGRNRRRSSLTMSMVAIGITFTVLIGGMSGSLNLGINNFVRQQLGADIYIMPTGGSLPVSYADNISSISGVNMVTYLKIQPTSVDGRTTALVGVDALTFDKVWRVGVINSTYTVDQIFTTLSQSNASMIMASGLAGRLSVNVGENVSVLVEGGKFQNFTVIAIFFGSDFINLGPISENEMTMTNYKALVNSFPSQYNATRDANIFLIKVNQGEDPNAVAQRITTATSGTIYIFTVSDVLKQVVDGISRIFAFFQVLVLMAVIVSLLGMTTTMIMSILERRREIGILRAIGISKNQVTAMIVGEALILGVIGLLAGVATGMLALNYFIDIMAFALFAVPLDIPYTVLLYVALASIIISVVSAAYPAYGAAKMNVVDTIRYG
ncbi:MAG: FtsX-like permease family protein [Promethearchaeati archaeon SRVP18_Atabeyarchaeia-1]